MATQANPFDQFDEPAASTYPGVIQGRPKVEKAPEPKTTFRTLTPDEIVQRGLNPTRTYQVSSEGKIDDLGDNAPKGAQTDAQRGQAIQSLRETIDKLDTLAFDAGDNGGWGETGLTGSVMSNVPGTAARDLSGAITSVQANTAFDKLQNLKMNSPNGGGLGGATSDADMALLKSSVANLDQGQSAESFFGNVAQAKRSYLLMLERLDPAAAAEYAKKKGIRFDAQGNPALFYVDGEDDRPKRDPFGVLPGQTPPDGGTPGGGISGEIKLDPRLYNPEGGQGIIDLAKQGITLGFSDEAAGAGGYLAALLTGNDPSKAYARERDAARENISRARVAHPVVGTLAEFLGGGASVKIAGGAQAVGNMVRQGAGLGAFGGFGYGEGDNSLASAAGGAVVGGALGGALGGVGKFMEGRAARNALSPEQVNVIEAGQRQGIPIRQPDVRPALRNELAQVETTGAGGPIVQQARAGDAAAIETRVGEIGGGGSTADPYALGTKVQDAGRNYIARTKAQAGRMYDKARELAGERPVQPTEALAALDAQIADLRATGKNANAEAIRYLDDVRDDLAKDGGVTIDAIRNIRTNMRGQISQRGLSGTDTDRRVMAAIDGANLDMARDLPPEAAQAFKAADAFYKERQDFISKTLKAVMGDRNNPLPPETAAARLTSMTKGKGNFERFSAMWKELTPEDQADTAATIAETLGRKANGEFSVPALIKSLDPNKGLNPRTARLVFGEDGAKALTDLRAIAAAKDETQRALNNSRTGTAVSATGDSLRTLMWGLFGFTQGGPVGAAGGAAARGFISNLSEKRAARMLMNPDFTKLLRNAPNTNNPETINRYFSRVAGVLAANDNEALTGAIASAFRKSPGMAAANEEADRGGEPPQ